MRVAVVAEWYPSPGDPVLGVWAHRQAVAARNAGAEVRVIALRRPIPPLTVARGLFGVPPALAPLGRWIEGARTSLRPMTLDGLEVAPVPFVAPPRPVSYGSWGYWMAPPLRRALDGLYARWRFDVLHAHCLAPAGHGAARWIRQGRAGGPAFVVSGHGPDMIHVPESSSVGRRACKAAMAAADLVLANSTWAARRCREIAARPLPARVVHLGADLRPPAISPSGGPIRLVTVAHLVARKRHDVVLRALARLDPAHRPEYLVIGDGPCRPGLERLADELGVADGVRFLGQLPNPEAVARAAACDLFVMPGVEEPFGVAFVEAMAAGLPAIGSRGEGGPEDIAAAGQGMVLVEPDDPAALAAVLDRLTVDRAELARLGAAARETVAANFTWERCGVETVAAYREALAARRTRAPTQP
ncbi:MAG: glycosyltransferase family 4 protein [Solirubrobacterales bacterium]|nr:glycosyltransferase family 4 protein [Solirubrobacterales bacterium]